MRKVFIELAVLGIKLIWTRLLLELLLGSLLEGRWDIVINFIVRRLVCRYGSCRFVPMILLLLFLLLSNGTLGMIFFCGVNIDFSILARLASCTFVTHNSDNIIKYKIVDSGNINPSS